MSNRGHISSTKICRPGGLHGKGVFPRILSSFSLAQSQLKWRFNFALPACPRDFLLAIDFWQTCRIKWSLMVNFLRRPKKQWPQAQEKSSSADQFPFAFRRWGPPGLDWVRINFNKAPFHHNCKMFPPPTTNAISTVKFISKISRVVKEGGLPLKPHLHALKKNQHGTPNFERRR